MFIAIGLGKIMGKSLHSISIATRAWMILVLFAVGLIANTLLDASKTRGQMRESYISGMEMLVESAESTMNHYYQQFQRGELSEQEAKARAVEAIRSISFDDGNYIFLIERDGMYLSGAASLIGTNIYNMQDSKGEYFVQKLLRTAQDGGGSVDYDLIDKNTNQPVPKTSFVKEFGPWKLVIGGGVNMVALQKDIEKSEIASMTNAALILVVLSVFITFFIRTITQPLKKTVDAMANLAQGEGDLTQRLDESGSKELRELAVYFNQFVASIQSIMLNISDSGAQLSSAIHQMTVSVKNIDGSLNQQQADTEQLATAMTEMLATVEEVAGRTAEANNASQLAAKETDSGKTIITSNADESDRLSQDIQDASTVVTKLSEDSRNVDTVLKVIRGVAEQTNLLALNAAIEAARAGETGRGFAVVADEVRTLSQRTQESTIEIQNIVEKLQRGAESVVNVMTKGAKRAESASKLSANAGEALQRITHEVHTIESMSHHIATAAEQQTVTVNDINRNVVSLRDMSSQVSEESTQLAGSSEELRVVSENLIKMINRFKLA